MSNQIDEEDAQVLANVRAHFSTLTESFWDLRIHTKLKPQLNSDDCGVFGTFVELNIQKRLYK